MERNKKNRQKLMGRLTENAKKIQRILEYIPEAYVDPELRLILADEIVRCLENALQIMPNNEAIKASLQSAQADQVKAKEKKARSKPALPTKTEEAGDLRKRLMDLFKIVQWLQKNQRINKALANKHLTLLKRAFIELGATTHLIRAKVALADKNHRLGVHFYQKAVAEYKHGDAKYFDAKIKELSGLIIKIQAELELSKVTPPNDTTESPESRVSGNSKQLTAPKKPRGSNGLDLQTDEFGEGASWKKKTF